MDSRPRYSVYVPASDFGGADSVALDMRTYGVDIRRASLISDTYAVGADYILIRAGMSGDSPDMTGKLPEHAEPFCALPNNWDGWLHVTVSPSATDVYLLFRGQHEPPTDCR